MHTYSILILQIMRMDSIILSQVGVAILYRKCVAWYLTYNRYFKSMSLFLFVPVFYLKLYLYVTCYNQVEVNK